MGLVNQEVFVNQLVGSNNERNRTAAARSMRAHLEYVVRGHGGDRQYDRESALECFAAIKDYIKQRGYLPGKYLRPWDIDPNLYAGLDRAEPWWGFEFEVGYKSAALRADAIEHCWNTWDNVTFDTEGEGQAPVEITFQPEERSKYVRGESKAQQFMAYMAANKGVQKTDSDRIGTHINMSSPKLNAENHGLVVAALQRTIAHLPMSAPGVRDVRLAMVGRSNFYGSFFANQSGNNVWIEGKLFRTTYDLAQFANYIKTSDCLSRCMEALADVFTNRVESPYTLAKSPFVSNLFEMWQGNNVEPIIDWDINRGGLDGMRGNGHVNGTYARDQFVMPQHVRKDKPVQRALHWCDVCQMEHE